MRIGRDMMAGWQMGILKYQGRYVEDPMAKVVEEAERIVIQNHRVRIEDVEDREREFERRITKIEDLKEHLQIALSENVTLRQRVDSLLLELESGKYVASGNVLSAKSAGTPAQAPADTSPAKFLK